jgi:hypothetical protein
MGHCIASVPLHRTTRTATHALAHASDRGFECSCQRKRLAVAGWKNPAASEAAGQGSANLWVCWHLCYWQMSAQTLCPTRVFPLAGAARLVYVHALGLGSVDTGCHVLTSLQSEHYQVSGSVASAQGFWLLCVLGAVFGSHWTTAFERVHQCGRGDYFPILSQLALGPFVGCHLCGIGSGPATCLPPHSLAVATRSLLWIPSQAGALAQNSVFSGKTQPL